MPAYSRIEGTFISYQKYHADTNDEAAKIYNIDFPVQAIFLSTESELYKLSVSEIIRVSVTQHTK